MKYVFLLVLALFVCFPAFSQDKTLEKLKTASLIPDPALRLLTYDAILEEAGLKVKAPEVSPVPDESKWTIHITTDPINDSKIFIFTLTADFGKGVYGDPVILIIRHTVGGDDELFVNWDSYLGDKTQVTMRIGTDPADTSYWSMSTDSRATFYPGETTKLINYLLRNEKFVLKCAPYNETPITAMFDIRGLSAKAQPHSTDLGWFFPEPSKPKPESVPAK